ncbi:MAG: glycosyl hydrolase family 17 protein [Bacteroidota bacterium]
MKLLRTSLFGLAIGLLLFGCAPTENAPKGLTLSAADILGNPDYQAISYGGYREKTRDAVPTVEQLKEDMKILAAMNVKLLRTYNTQQFAQAAKFLEAIKQLKAEDADFEMYVMLGAWIDCENAWTDNPNHHAESLENNTAEIAEAVELVNKYPDIVKIIAVGNEAMVHWAANYFVYPNVILKWVNHLKDLREKGEIPAGTWITSSDNYESWGGKDKSYHTEDLEALIEAVDYISLHTYPFHDSHYNPAFWGTPDDEAGNDKVGQMDAAMLRAKEYAISQYDAVVDYLKEIGIEKLIHIGETGWASVSGSFYGTEGSRAADEYKEKRYYEHMRDWTNIAGMSCFYFEAFDEQWKDPGSALGSENHFGLITLQGEAKYALWDMVDAGAFAGLTRDGQTITKTYGGDEAALLEEVMAPPLASEIGGVELTTTNEGREAGEPVAEQAYVVFHSEMTPDESNDQTYPSANLRINAWEGTCSIVQTNEGILEIKPGTGDWWGCGLEMTSEVGEDLSAFAAGTLHFDMKGSDMFPFTMGYQSGTWSGGNQTNNFLRVGKEEAYQIKLEWTSYSIPVADINQGANWKDITAPLFFRGDVKGEGQEIYLRNIYYTQN